jgi:predicted amidophosphoribosyltransferase
MTNSLIPKIVACRCGHEFETSKHKSWCEKCCRPVFYHAKDQRWHQWTQYYMITMMVSAMVFVTYLFLEMIAKPLLSL